MFTTDDRIQEQLLDPHYLHLHHAEIAKALERGRLRFLEARGVPNERLLARGLLPVLTELSLRFLREVRSGEIVVSCENPHFDGKSFRLEQRLVNERGKLAVEASVVIMFIDEVSRRSVLPDKAILDALANDPAVPELP